MNPTFIMWIENLIKTLLGLQDRPAVCYVVTGKKPTLAEVVHLIHGHHKAYGSSSGTRFKPLGVCPGGLTTRNRILFFTNSGS